MTLFNRKEHVIKIELTRYGKDKLRQGEFEPYYYSFHDDDILYDTQYAGFTENQDDTEDRIEQTPRITPVYSFEGADINQALNEQTTRENLHALQTPLGSVDLAGQEAPFYFVKFLKGNMTGSVDVKQNNLPRVIPTINVEETTTVQKTTITDGYFDDIYGTFKTSNEHRDVFGNTLYGAPRDYIILRIEEGNARFLVDNFEIEVLLLEEVTGSDGTTRTEEFPLYFDIPFFEEDNKYRDDYILKDEDEEDQIIPTETGEKAYHNI